MLTRKLLYCLIATSCVAHAADETLPVRALAITPTPTELNYSTGALQIRADYAWARDIAGQNVVIGVLDSGVWGSHPEFDGRVLAGYDFVHGLDLAAGADSDDELHGTHVAGILGAGAGSGYLTGVAPRAQILPVKVLDASGSGYLTDLAAGLDYSIARGAKVVNLSLGWDGGGYLPVEQALKRSVAANQVVVAAAGNESAANPSWPARYASQTWANGQILAVGAVDTNNKLASFSNKAGDARNFFLVAPGTNILSTIPPNRPGLSDAEPWYAIASGTSMATPYVAGAVALLEGNWPQLSAKQAASILLTTATDLGKKGADPIYGRGLVNVEKALQPVGKKSVPTRKGKAAPRGIASNPLLSRLRSAADAGAFRTILVDSYNRDYQVDLGDSIAAAPGLTLSQLFSGMDAKLRYEVMESPDGLQFAATYTDEPGKPRLNSFSFRQRFAGGEELAFGTADFAGTFLGLADTPFAGLGLAGRNPLEGQFLGLARAQSFAGYGFTLAPDWTLKSALLSGSDLGLNPATDGLGLPLAQGNGSSVLAALELTRSFENGKFALSIGRLSESGRVLGGETAGVFAVDAVDTDFVSASTAYRLRPDTWLAANLSMGSTSAEAFNGMIAGLDGAASLGWTLGLLRENALRDHDRIGFSVSQPLAAMSGSMQIDRATGVNVDGSYRYASERIGLAGGARETDFEFDYLAPLTANSSLSAALIYRVNPGNDSAADPEAMLGLRWQLLTY